MVDTIAAFERPLVRLLSCSVLALCGFFAATLAEAQSPAAKPASDITEITLERDCFGCSAGSILVLRRDGSARITTTGKARHGTVDRTARGSVRADDFDALARLAVAQGFFELNDTYEDPQHQDGSWTTTGIACGAKDKRVFRRDDAGPLALKTLEKAIEALQARIKFAPDNR